MIAKNIIEDDESAIVIFTDEAKLKIFDGGFASTGDLVIDNNLAVDRAIIYKRNSAANQIEIYLATPLDVYPSKQIGRKVMRLADLNFVGTTECSWNEFTESKKGATNRIKYINRKRSRTYGDRIFNLS